MPPINVGGWKGGRNEPVKTVFELHGSSLSSMSSDVLAMISNPRQARCEVCGLLMTEFRVTGVPLFVGPPQACPACLAWGEDKITALLAARRAEPAPTSAPAPVGTLERILKLIGG